MLTSAAATTAAARNRADRTVVARAALYRSGSTRSSVSARIAAGRWQAFGNAVVLHNGELTKAERWAVGVLNCGPRAVLASFSALEQLGLKGWERDETHVLVPAGVPRPQISGIPVTLHRSVLMDGQPSRPGRRCTRIEPAVVLAASSFVSPRPAVGILAAAVQQRLTTGQRLRSAVLAAPRARHRGAMRLAVGDIEMGAQALSEIDFVRLCRRHGLPAPTQQAVRVEPSGRRRYLDAAWVRRDGRRVAVEVDGALHLVARRWYDDQLRRALLL